MHQHSLSRVQAAIADHLLGHLTTCQLGRLRGTCKAWRDTIDALPLEPLLPAAKEVIPEAILPLLKEGLDLQAAARLQGQILSNIRAACSIQGADAVRLQALPAGSKTCTGWSQWSFARGHQWAVGSSHTTHPAAAPSEWVRPIQQWPCHIPNLHPLPDATSAYHQVISTRSWQAGRLPEVLGWGGQFFSAGWTAWLCGSQLLVCKRNGSLHVFKPGTDICHSRFHDGPIADLALLAPATSSQILWPCPTPGQSNVLMLNLPALTERYQVPWPGPGMEGLLPQWVAWCPHGAFFAVAWDPSHHSQTVRQELQMQLHIHAAADGSLHGRCSLPWNHAQHRTSYRWMHQGNCIVVLTKEVANVISSTGQVLQVVRSEPWKQIQHLSPDGEFMHMNVHTFQ